MPKRVKKRPKSKRRKDGTFPVNDRKIWVRKYYPYYYDKWLRVNVVPISYFTKYEARLVLDNYFPGWKGKIFLAKGFSIRERGWQLGKNSIFWEGKHRQVRKMYIPPEYDTDRVRREYFQRKYRKVLTEKTTKSNINKYLKNLYLGAI